MRLLSYNIHGCIGRDGIEDPSRIVKVIREIDADIVGLQEVYSDDDQDRDFLLKLQTLPYPTVLYGKTMRKESSDYGNLLLFKGSVEAVERMDLTADKSEPRGAIVVDMNWRGNKVRIASTHLGLSASQRKVQLDELTRKLFAGPPVEVMVLMGDLNEWLPVWPYFKKLASSFEAMSMNRTFPTMPALFALDRILVAGKFNDVHFHTVRNELSLLASDHLPLVCELHHHRNGI